MLEKGKTIPPKPLDKVFVWVSTLHLLRNQRASLICCCLLFSQALLGLCGLSHSLKSYTKLIRLVLKQYTHFMLNVCSLTLADMLELHCFLLSKIPKSPLPISIAVGWGSLCVVMVQKF